MAWWMKTTGETTEVKPGNGQAFTLEEMQKLVGGYVEALKLDTGEIMWLNDVRPL